MVETDWREILSFSQRELMQADKDKLCESLSWMEADDIELNFADLKTLFRLAQDILKYKSEQVNNLMGELEKENNKGGKKKSRNQLNEPPIKSADNVLETITNQEEVIKANKEILEQLNSEIAALEERKNKYEENKNEIDKDSDSSRDPLSEIDSTVQLENEIFKKNRHIRKLLIDVKILEEENVKLKDKLSQIKDKLKEATQLIENLTEQLFSVNSECNELKEILATCEQTKIHLLAQVNSLSEEISAKDMTKENIQENVKLKIQHLKNALKSHKSEIERLSTENTQLKEQVISASKIPIPPNDNKTDIVGDIQKVKTLEEKLIEASSKIEQSADFIQLLKTENKRLKNVIDEAPELSVHENNESDDGKQRKMIMRLKDKLKKVTVALQATEDIVTMREKEVTKIASQLHLVQSEEGINTLLKRLKSNKRQLKVKDEKIKQLVFELNTLHQCIDELQVENETLRQKLNIPLNHKIPTQGILKKYQDIQQNLLRITKELHENENKLVSTEMDNRNKNIKINKLMKLLNKLGYKKENINETLEAYTADEDFDADPLVSQENNGVDENTENIKNSSQDPEIQAIIDENEGLRVGLQEILEFIKDNSTTTSGILLLKCPTLELICNSMAARHAAGWFAPHMSTLMELKTALGGRDALLTALHESRKDTFEVMKQLSEQTEKSSKLEQKLTELETHDNKEKLKGDELNIANAIDFNEFGNWLCSEESNNIDFNNKDEMENIILKGNLQFENTLKNSLYYFQGKFKLLYENLTSLSVTVADNHNKWLIQEENYVAEIENLKTQLLQNADDDTSVLSPGLLSNPDIAALQRKCSYLEESYKHIRTQNENLKTECSECKRDLLSKVSDYEIHIQDLMLCNINLADRLRRCVPEDLFWKQNVALNEFIIKYRNAAESFVHSHIEKNALLQRLQNDKSDILRVFENRQTNKTQSDNHHGKKFEQNAENLIHEKQLEELTTELLNKNAIIQALDKKNEEIQIASGKLYDTLITSKASKDESALEQEIYKMREENKQIRQENQRIHSKLDITLLKLQETEQQKNDTGIEINLLRHQILDLQSSTDNKAIIARLSGEILIAHMQISEYVKKIERLTKALNKEKYARDQAKHMLTTRQRIFDYNICTNENKFRNMLEILHVFRKEYQGSLPLCTIESYHLRLEELNNKKIAANETLEEIENLRLHLMMKHSVYDQILETAKAQCIGDENRCKHALKSLLTNKINANELDLCNKKIQILERSRKEILDRCHYLERTLLLINQGHKVLSLEEVKSVNNDTSEIHFDKHSSCSSAELQDIPSEDETSSSKNLTFTVAGPKLDKSTQIGSKGILSDPRNNNCHLNITNIGQTRDQKPELFDATTQTNIIIRIQKDTKYTQTEEDNTIRELRLHIKNLNMNLKQETEKWSKLMSEIQRLTQELSIISEQKYLLENKIENLTDSHDRKDEFIKSLQYNIVTLKDQIDDFKNNQYAKILQEKNVNSEENNALLQTLKELESEKNSIISEYKELLKKERDEYANTVKDLQAKLIIVQSQLESREPNVDIVSRDVNKDAVSKYIQKITELEDKCFKLQSNLDGFKTEINTCQSELDRWKDLAAERLSKMEQLNTQLQERHNDEVESYKAENQHWMSQLNETQREHMDLRTRLTEQKAQYVKQLTDKDAHIEHLRTVVNNLKTQVMSMQTMLSINDPSFDLSAIVEVEEASDKMSSHGSERLELKFESAVDLHDFQEDYNIKIPTTSTAIWYGHEPLIERLRREKQQIAKQNAILRRQIKAVAARERRARLDAQNLKNQVFRISTSGNKVATVESAALQNKIASLQAQLTSARRDAHSTVAIWDKWKRAQQAADKWQARYEEKCQEGKKLETSLNLSKSALARFEKEKRVLLSRVSELKSERSSATEKQDDERSEKGSRSHSEYTCASPPPVSTRALLDRIQAQQRRIAALEMAEKGNEPLVSEYERALAEITSLKGQVLKLESTLLESQIRSPLNPSSDSQPELEYWKSYCDMLKEENTQLTLRVNTLEITPTSAHQQRINDLEQTILTLRGLVSKLQAEQKSGVVRRTDSRPGSGRSTIEKVRNQIDSYRTEISNLKRTIHEKDLLLERSKEMLKIAAEREDELLKENALLRRRFEELVEDRGGLRSA